jgi:predicted alpha/beta-hydrolase family hydrolase
VPLTPPQAVAATTAFRDVPDDDAGGPVVVLAHGAGSGPESDVLTTVAARLATQGTPTVRFTFAYRQAGRRAPDPAARLFGVWRDVLSAVRQDYGTARPVVIGGFSMGGRYASMLAAQGDPCTALVLLAYPLHPAGRPDRLRTDHWATLGVPSLFVSGQRDPLCDLELLDQERARRLDSTPSTLHLIQGGDHSFRVPTGQRRTRGDVLDEVASQVTSFVATAPRGVSA